MELITQPHCQLCNDKGVLKLHAGFAVGMKRCDCRPAEVWDKFFQEKMDRWYKDFFGPETRLSDGEMEHAGR